MMFNDSDLKYNEVRHNLNRLTITEDSKELDLKEVELIQSVKDYIAIHRKRVKSLMR